MTHVYLVAAEPSGDLLASEVIEAIRSKSPETRIHGIGGEEMAAAGVQSPFDVSELSVLGILEGVKIYKRVLELADQAVNDIISKNPDVVGLVDSWGFMIRVAERLRKRAPHIRLVKIVGPQVWAMRPGRAKSLARAVDHLVCIHAFETPFYEPLNLPVTVMGNPALSRGHVGDRDAGRAALGLSGDDKVLLVLPGSRRSEIDQVAPVLEEASRRVKDALPDIRVVFHPSPTMRSYMADAFPNLEHWAQVSPVEADRYDIMACADYALACSGTVTSELALQSTPFLVGYHTGWVTWAIARFLLFKPTHITLLNIAADDTEVVPEFVQTKLKAGPIAATAQAMLTDPEARQSQIEAQKKALSRMGESKLDSAVIAAGVLLEMA
ncbi:lipid-A-disaccharide synthase [Henriciella sp.]|uniref:lipid-A-disaccharide synthase n=1 Tax=Henriciella sp. TaxID=1968823 RepID=UPI0026258DC5|nr:lipid-A-disaccharide synthase [Henriciella sp.]